MNVLQIVPELNAGGVERTTIEVAQALAEDGYTPHVASLGGRMERELTSLGGVLHTFDVGSKNPLQLRRNTKQLIDIINNHAINIVHARSRAPAWPAYRAAKATSTPFVTTYHGIYNAKGPIKRRYNSIMAMGERVIANSEYTKAHIISEHGTDPDKITVIPRGVDLERFDLTKLIPDNIEDIYKAWEIDAGKTIILLPGRLTRWKGQKVAIEALKLLPESYVLVCLGDAQGRDDYVSELKRDCERFGLIDRVLFPGHSENMPAALACADVVISASTDPEAFGRIAAEAQAMQRPIVATAHGGSLETVMEEETGFLVPSGQSEALAKSIEKAVNWETYDGLAARTHIAENFSKKSLQAKTLDIYRQVML